MKTIRNNNIIYCDVDGTLIFWKDPYLRNDDAMLFIDPRDGEQLYGVPNTRLINWLKRAKQVGKRPIVVWSASGWQWAEAAVHALGLEDVVDVVANKPYGQGVYIDDKGIGEQKLKRKMP